MINTERRRKDSLVSQRDSYQLTYLVGISRKASFTVQGVDEPVLTCGLKIDNRQWYSLVATDPGLTVPSAVGVLLSVANDTEKIGERTESTVAKEKTKAEK